jgi:hypothetical protein
VIRRFSILTGALVVSVAMIVPGITGSATASGRSVAGYTYFRDHGYLMANPALYARAKAEAAAKAGLRPVPGELGLGAHAPVANPSFQGVFESDLSPPDTTGAIGPHSYVEFINLQLGLFSRTGAPMGAAPVEALFGDTHFNYSDPQALWDPHTNRFFLLIWHTSDATMRWAFSKTSNPLTLTSADWCTFSSSFGYNPNDAPDYPKFGQTKDFLLIGVNFFQNFQTFLGGELLTIQKPQGSGPVTTCPPNTFGTHRFTNLRMIGTQLSNAPEPAQQADPSSTGYVVAVPGMPASGNTLAVWTVTNSGGTPVVTGPTTVAVPSYSTPPSAPQCMSPNRLDTLDGRLEHAVTARDPTTGAIQLWTAHAVAGGAGSEERWYEINPATASISQSGKATSASLYVWNGAIAPDRTVRTVGGHGSNMVMDFSTSSSTQCAAIQMVSKIGANPQSGFVMVMQSTVPDNDFSCTRGGGVCRWGDYSGASPDPGVPFSDPTGKVWLANEWLSGPNPGGTPNWRTWIWGATP